MNCPRHNELSAYADQAMKPGEHARFHQHLQACPVCQQQLEGLQTLRQNLRALPSPTLGFDLASRLEDRLRHPPKQRRRPWQALWGSGGSGWLPTGLAASVALVSGVWLGGLLLGGGSTGAAPRATLVRVFDPVPPGGLCAAVELCHLPKGMP